LLTGASLWLSLPLILELLVLIIAWVSWRQRPYPGSAAFSWMMGALCVCLGVELVRFFVSDLVTEYLLWGIDVFCLSSFAIQSLIFVFNLYFPQMDGAGKKAPWLYLFLVAGMVWLIAHGWPGNILGIIQPGLMSEEGYIYQVFYQPSWGLMIAFGCAISLISVFLLTRKGFSSQEKRPVQWISLIFALGAAWTGFLIDLFKGKINPANHLTLLGILVSVLLFGGAYLLIEFVARPDQFQNFSSILSGIGRLAIDPYGKVVYLDPQAGHFLGVHPKEAMYQPYPIVLAKYPKLIEALQSGTPGMVEIGPLDSIERKKNPQSDSGSSLPEQVNGLTATIHAAQPGMGNMAVLISFQETDRYWMMNDKTLGRDELIRTIFRSNPNGTVILDEGGDILFASPQALKLFQPDPDSAIKLGQVIQQWMREGEEPETKPLVGEADDVDNQFIDFRMIREDGSFFWGEVHAQPFPDPAWNSLRILSIHNITERKNAEIRLNKELEQQTFLNNLLRVFLKNEDVQDRLLHLLDFTGNYFHADRVYLCEYSVDELEANISKEWHQAANGAALREGTLVHNKELPNFLNQLEDHRVVMVNRMEDADSHFQEFMVTWNILSFAALPVYGRDSRIKGFLGIDFCAHHYHWKFEDRDVLEKVGQIYTGLVTQRDMEEAEKRQTTLAEALHDTSSALNSTLHLEELLDRILENLEKVVQHDAASIALVDDEETISYVRWRGYDDAGENFMRSTKIAMRERETYSTMINTGKPIIIHDTWLEKHWVRYWGLSWIRSYAGAPIRVKGKTIGFINLDSTKPDFFNTDLSYSLSVFADQAAIAIENARLYDQVRQRAEELGILYRIGLTLTTGLEMRNVLESLYQQCSQVLPIDVFYVAMFNPETGQIDIPTYFQQGEFLEIKPRNIYTEPGTTGEVIRRRRRIYLPDTLSPEIAQEYHVVRLGGTPSRSYVGIPLILLDQVVGVISMQSFQPNAYTEDQIRLFETIGTQAAIAIQNARMFDTMKQMAITDPVTLLNSRRHFMTLAKSEIDRALRYNRALSVLMIDIDHFKLVNDTHGHMVGDIVLQTVANTCRAALRETDIIGRWGGEEFSVVLPEADRIGAAMIAERIRRIVGDLDIQVGQDVIHVTVSVGAATMNDQCRTIDALMDIADRALYVAKQAGRNQVKLID
jgi:diguanylate cyclase (GGDEF)-like protein/PAS domain S-box-containing protein